MKKSLVLGILGLATAAVSSYGQGNVFLDNYLQSTFNPVVLSDGITKAPAGYTVQIYYGAAGNNFAAAFNTAAAGDTTGMADPTTLGALVAGSGAGSTAAIYSSPALAGYFTATSSFQIQPGSANPAQSYFTIVIAAYNGSSYDALNTTFRGYSQAVYIQDASPIVAGGADIGTFYPNGTSMAYAPMIEVHPVPEPTTLALGGLGGLAMLLMRRRKA